MIASINKVKENAATKSKPKATRKRNVHDVHGGISEKEVTGLMSKLWEQAAINGHSLKELADLLGLSYTYLMKLARGESPTEKIDREHIVIMSKYLNLPVGQTYLLSGGLVPEDLIFEPTKEEKIQYAYQAMRNDPLWAAYAPSKSTWEHSDASLKLLICLLYERAARTNFFDDTEVPVYPAKK